MFDPSNFDLLEMKNKFISASPFPHIIIDNFLDKEFAIKIAKKFDEELPDLNNKFVKSFDTGYGGDKKRQISPNGCTLETQLLVGQFNQQPFLDFLESLTGIHGLIGDSSYEGGGFHLTGKGGRLGVHVDFRVHKRLKLKRELNAIIYLNDKWDDNWGGGLELWSRDKKNCAKKVSPKFNRCVIFQTDDSSYHGHPHPLLCPIGVSRKSLALYFYTGSDLVYAENSRKTTDYIDGENTTFELKNKVRYWLINFCLDYLPPILTRRIFRKRN